MRLLYFVFIVVLISVESQAASYCLDKIAEIQMWPEIVQSEIECLRDQNQVSESFSTLCTNDEKEVSPIFFKYIDFYNQRQLAWDELVEAKRNGSPIEVSMASQKLNQIEQNWLLFGYQEEVEELLEIIEGAFVFCQASK